MLLIRCFALVPSLVTTGVIGYTAVYWDTDTDSYRWFTSFIIVPMVFLSSVCFLWAYDTVTLFLFRRPAYVEDLAKYSESNPMVLRGFLVSAVFFTSLTVCAVFEYAFARYGLHNHGLLEGLGIIGGLLTLFQKLEGVFGKCILNLMIIREKFRESPRCLPAPPAPRDRIEMIEI